MNLLNCSYLNQAAGTKKLSASASEVAPADKGKGKSKKSVRFEVDEDYVEDDDVEDEAAQASSESDDDFDLSQVNFAFFCIRTSLFMKCVLIVFVCLYLMAGSLELPCILAVVVYFFVSIYFCLNFLDLAC